MFTPFMVNYFAAMSLWKTKYSTEMVKKTFIFPLQFAIWYENTNFQKIQ